MPKQQDLNEPAHKEAATWGVAWGAWAVVAVALLARVVCAVETREVPTVWHLVGDAAGYYRWAQEIAGGAWVGTEPFYQAPLYPYVLAVCFKVFGEGVGTIRMVQAVWGAAACGLIYIGTRRLFGRSAGVIAGMMLVLYAPAIFFDGIVQKASLTCLLVCAMFAAVSWHGTTTQCAEREWGKDRARRLRSGFGLAAIGALVIGMIVGLLAITRENAMVWVPILGGWIWTNCRLSIVDCRMKRRSDEATKRRRGRELRVTNYELQITNYECGNPGAPGPALRFGAETRKLQGTEARRQEGTNAQSARSKRRWAGVGAYVFGVGVVLGPVGVRNAVVSGEWSVSTFQAGPNFYIGNHRGADGRYRPLVKGHETPEFEREDATRLAQEAVGRPLSAREVSEYWMGRALEEIGADPGGWLRLMGRKMAMVWNRYEVSDAESLYVYGESSVVLGVLGRAWHFGVLCPLAAVGLVGTWGERRRLWVYYALIASMAAAVAAFYVLGRYRYPLALLLIPFAATGCVELWKRARAADVRALLRRGAVMAMVAAAVNWPVQDERRLNAMARMNVGVALAEAGQLAAAVSYFRLALTDHPGSAEGHNNLAQALVLGGDFAGAIEHYEAAIAIEPGLIGVDYNLGVALERVGRRDEALRAYERAAARDLSDAEARKAAMRLANGD